MASPYRPALALNSRRGSAHFAHRHGWPSEECLYVFNGDLVDRGSCSVEVALLLFAWHQCLPDSVFLNRGNHEESAINAVYGFLSEVLDKYDRATYLLFDSAFKYLPLATIIDDATFVVHAGIDQDTTLALIEAVPRHLFSSDGMKDTRSQRHIRLPADKKKEAEKEADHQALLGVFKGGGVVSKKDQKEQCRRVVAPLLWSDPQTALGSSVNQKRGAGSKYGPDVAADFLSREGLRMMIRSHECVPDGYAWPYGAKQHHVLTLFSASNYCGRNLNKGAVAVFHYGAAAAHIGTTRRIGHTSLKEGKPPELIQYEAEHITAEEVDLRNVLFLQSLIQERLPRIREALVAAAAEQVPSPAALPTASRAPTRRLIRHRGGSAENANAAVPVDDGDSLNVAKWAEAMERALRLRLPWRKLQPMLAPATTADGRISVGAFVARYTPAVSGSSGAIHGASDFAGALGGASANDGDAAGGGGDEADSVSREAVADAPGPATEASGSSGGALAQELLFARRQMLTAILQRMDVDATGCIAVERLHVVCRLMGSRFPDEQQLFASPERILKLLDVAPRDDGLLEISAFVEAFHLKARSLAAQRQAELPAFAFADSNHPSRIRTKRMLPLGGSSC